MVASLLVAAPAAAEPFARSHGESALTASARTIDYFGAMNPPRLDGAATPVMEWSLTGPMTRARYFHTATVLRSGCVLVVGGVTSDSSASPSRTAELYNPTRRSWRATEPLNTARYNHSATLLPDGRVLVVGGRSDERPLGMVSAELFDPDTGAWLPTGSLHRPRWGHTASLLPDGRVLIAGGYSDSGPTASTEIWEPRTASWSLSASLVIGRYFHTATTLRDGRVLVTGGSVPEMTDAATASSEMFQPTTGVWTAVEPMSSARLAHGATLLRNGRVLVVGGDRVDGQELASVEIYDPVSGAWSVAAPMHVARRQFALVQLFNGLVVVAGGYAAGGLTGTEIYNPAHDRWTVAADLEVPRDGPVGAVLDTGDVLVAGGCCSLNSAETLSTAPPSHRVPRQPADVRGLPSSAELALLAKADAYGNELTAANRHLDPGPRQRSGLRGWACKRSW